MTPTPPRQPVLAFAVWIVGFALVAVVAALVTGLALELGASVARGYWPIVWIVLASWRTVLGAALLVVLVAIWGRHPELPSGAALRRHPVRWLVAAAVLVGYGVQRAANVEPQNALGLLADRPNATSFVDRHHPYRKPTHVHANRLGFRDRDHARDPAPGVVRVAVVGDSYVYGKGIQEVDGLIHRQLKQALAQAAPGRSFEVINAGYPGWGYFTYFEAARRVLREFKPRVIVIGSLGASDYDLFDYQQQAETVGVRAFRAMSVLGAAEDLKAASIRYSLELSGDDAAFARAAGIGRLRRVAAALRADAERAGCDVIVWEYYVPFPLLRELAVGPRLHLAGWPPGFDRRLEGWGRDARLSIPGDYHPTGAGNALVARYLAPEILRVLGGPAPAPAPAAPASAAAAGR